MVLWIPEGFQGIFIDFSGRIFRRNTVLCQKLNKSQFDRTFLNFFENKRFEKFLDNEICKYYKIDRFLEIQFWQVSFAMPSSDFFLAKKIWERTFLSNQSKFNF